jgi:predicted outer membrane protein
MTFKPATWFPIAAVLAAINVVAIAFAAAPLHATAHGALAVAFAVWAQRLRHRLRTPELPAELEVLELEVNELRQELSEARERLDFAERVLTQQAESRRMGPER